MKRLILIRHGLIDRATLRLNDKGLEFAEKLPGILALESLDYVCSDDSDRCRKTVSPLAERFSLGIVPFSKNDFLSCTVLKHLLRYSTSAVCYRIEAIDEILEALGLERFTEMNRDTAYEFIWDVYLRGSGDVCCSRKIPTGFSASGTDT